MSGKNEFGVTFYNPDVDRVPAAFQPMYDELKSDPEKYKCIRQSASKRSQNNAQKQGVSLDIFYLGTTCSRLTPQQWLYILSWQVIPAAYVSKRPFDLYEELLRFRTGLVLVSCFRSRYSAWPVVPHMAIDLPAAIFRAVGSANSLSC